VDLSDLRLLFPVLTEPWLLVVHGTVHRYLVGLLGGAGLGSRWKVDKGMGRLCDGLLGITAPVLSTGAETEGAGEGSDSDGEGKANWEDHPAKDQGNEPPATLYQSVLSSLGDVHCPALFPLPAFACTTFPHLLWARRAMCGPERKDGG
jgi:hypothetical protein